jgi:hypothetical protein
LVLTSISLFLAATLKDRMGRYTTVQTFADNNQRVAALPYEKASGGVKADPDARAPGVRVPVVQNVSGSTAGAGSSHFHVYRLERRREEERLKNMDASHDAMLSNQEYHARLEANRLECEARTQKRAEKRKREKAAKQLKKRDASGVRGAAASGGAARSDEADDPDDDEEEAAAASAAAAAPAPVAASSAAGAADLLIDDGKFLERYLRQKQQEQELAAAPAAADTPRGPSSSSDSAAAASLPERKK